MNLLENLHMVVIKEDNNDTQNRMREQCASIQEIQEYLAEGGLDEDDIKSQQTELTMHRILMSGGEITSLDPDYHVVSPLTTMENIINGKEVTLAEFVEFYIKNFDDIHAGDICEDEDYEEN